MTMPRPSGKALKIAIDTVPGLNINKKGYSSKKRKNIPSKDDVELKVTNTNENMGRNSWK